MNEVLVTWTHPFGEHWPTLKQQPPPVSLEHSTLLVRHFGGCVWDRLQPDGLLALQQKIFEAVKVVG